MKICMQFTWLQHFDGKYYLKAFSDIFSTNKKLDFFSHRCLEIQYLEKMRTDTLRLSD